MTRLTALNPDQASGKAKNQCQCFAPLYRGTVGFARGVAK